MDRKIVAQMPDTAGVYLMKDSSGRVIYIGKAKSLKKRINSYFGCGLASKTVALMANVSSIDYQLTPTESLALLLEAGLIRKHKPKYNVSLRDDKSFPFVKITREEFPAVYITRKKTDDNAVYLGPYTSAGLLRDALKIIRRRFPFRSCKVLPKKACVYYRIKLCPAPCIGSISKKSYSEIIKNISLILQGRTEFLIKDLTRKMNLSARQQQFEEAAKIRDQIASLSAIGDIQSSPIRQDELEDLKKLLGLAYLPERIEAFDISNIMGKEATGSMVSFWRGEPDKNNYRRFRIKSVSGIDDYGMLAEVINRRYSRIMEERTRLPGLVLIDGGKAHLLTAKKELDKLGLKIPLVSIAKEKENIYTEDRSIPIRLKSDTASLNLIRRLRDEAHRFAVSYHHLLRRKKLIGK